MQHQKALVDSGQWLLYRYHPDKGELQIDSRGLKKPVAELMKSEGRFRDATPEQIVAAQQDVDARWKLFNHYAALKG